MWNILVVIIIAIIIWLLNPLKSFSPRQEIQYNNKISNQAEQVINQTSQQVNQARYAQQLEQEQVDK